jgi:hypothetical protein
MMGSKSHDEPPDVEGKCNARLKRCRDRDCNYGFSKEEREVWTCPKCGKQRGKCKYPAARNGRCTRRHGGAVPHGFALPQTTTGRHSRYLPTRLVADYEEARNSERLLDLDDEIALVDARIADLEKRVDTSEAGSLWRQAHVSYDALIHAIRQDDKPAQSLALGDLQSILGRGVADYAAWDEIFRLTEQKRRLVDSQRKWYIQNRKLVAVESVMLFAAAVLSVIRENIQDRKVLAKIANALDELVNIESGG